MTRKIWRIDRRARTQKLRRLASHDLVMKAASEVHPKGNAFGRQMLSFSMNKNDLKEPAELADDIEDIRNRTIKTPRLVEEGSEPTIILDKQ